MAGIPIDGERLRDLLLARGAGSVQEAAKAIGYPRRDALSRAIRDNKLCWNLADRIKRAYGIRIWEYERDWREIACFY